MAGLPEKTRRNKEIYTKKTTGSTYRGLSVEYNLSIKRLQDIVNRERNNLREGNNANSNITE